MPSPSPRTAGHWESHLKRTGKKGGHSPPVLSHISLSLFTNSPSFFSLLLFSNFPPFLPTYLIYSSIQPQLNVGRSICKHKTGLCFLEAHSPVKTDKQSPHNEVLPRALYQYIERSVWSGKQSWRIHLPTT